MLKPGSPVTTINKASNAAVTATQNGAKVNGGNYGNAVAYLNVTAVTGTTPSLTVKFQDSADGATWYDIPSGAFTAATAATTQRLPLSNIGPFLRAVETISGTSPSFNFDLYIAGVN